VDPAITGDQHAAELWVENRGQSTTLLQARIFAWQQVSGREQYQTQRDIVATPAMVRLDAGQKQLIRLIRQTSPAGGEEHAYRVLLDEIPTPPDPPDDPKHSLSFQMRYSIPLFVYGPGNGADTGAPALSWRPVKIGTDTFLEITNRGPVHARLSNISLGKQQLTDGLYGYVLAHSSHRWPLAVNPMPGAVLQATVDNRNTRWQSAASAP